MSEPASYVYFIQSGDAGAIKIGVSNNVYKRLSLLQTGSSEKLTLIGCTHGDAALEKQMHVTLAAFRTRGEWFEPHPFVIDHINSFPRVIENLRFIPIRLKEPKNAFQAWRYSKRLTLEQVAVMIGVSHAQLCRIENGKSMPGWPLLKALHEVSDGVVTPNDFAAFMRDSKSEAA